MSRLNYPGQPEMGVHLSQSVTHHSLAVGYRECCLQAVNWCCVVATD